MCKKMSDLVSSFSFAEYAVVIDENGQTVAMTNDHTAPEKMEERRDALGAFVSIYSIEGLRVIVEDKAGTMILVRLPSGHSLVVAASEGASMGAVSIGVNKMLESLRQERS